LPPPIKLAIFSPTASTAMPSGLQPRLRAAGRQPGDAKAERQHFDELGQDGADEALGTVSS
jgi:hypothetical protein